MGSSYALVYVIGRFLFRIVEFFHHWYIDGSRAILHRFLGVLARLDYTFAVAVTARHFSEPLYGDYSFVGRILGFIFRAGRIVIGGAIYIVLGVAFLALYVAWLLAPLLVALFILRRAPIRMPKLPY